MTSKLKILNQGFSNIDAVMEVTIGIATHSQFKFQLPHAYHAPKDQYLTLNLQVRLQELVTI